MAFSGIDIGLLKFCIEHSDDPQNMIQNAAEDMSKFQRDPADYIWLRKALENLETEGQKMKKVLDQIKQGGLTHEQLVMSLETVLYFVEDVDCADYFQKIGGIDIISPLIVSENPIIRSTSTSIFVTVSQHNPPFQLELIQKGLFQKLDKLLESETHIECLKKQLSLLSSLLHLPEISQLYIDNYDGFNKLIKFTDHTEVQIKIKALWIIESLIRNKVPLDKLKITTVSLDSKIHELLENLLKPLTQKVGPPPSLALLERLLSIIHRICLEKNLEDIKLGLKKLGTKDLVTIALNSFNGLQGKDRESVEDIVQIAKSVIDIL